MDGYKQLFEEKPVVLGLSDGIQVEIKEGLTTEDQVRGVLVTKKTGK